MADRPTINPELDLVLERVVDVRPELDALGPGYRPKGSSFMTATILLEPEGTGTRYTAIAMHADADGKKKHEEMGFLDGWGAALDQLVGLAKEWS